MEPRDQLGENLQAAKELPAMLVVLAGIKAQFEYSEIRYMVRDLQNHLSPQVPETNEVPEWVPEKLRMFIPIQGGDHVDKQS